MQEPQPPARLVGRLAGQRAAEGVGEDSVFAEGPHTCQQKVGGAAVVELSLWTRAVCGPLGFAERRSGGGRAGSAWLWPLLGFERASGTRLTGRSGSSSPGCACRDAPPPSSGPVTSLAYSFSGAQKHELMLEDASDAVVAC